MWPLRLGSTAHHIRPHRALIGGMSDISISHWVVAVTTTASQTRRQSDGIVISRIPYNVARIERIAMKRFLQVLFTLSLICGSIAGGMPLAHAGAQGQSVIELYDELTDIKASEGEAAADVYFNDLSPEDQAAVGDFISQFAIQEEVSSGITPAASGCWFRTHSVQSTSSITGELFWRLSQSMYWCGDGPWITYDECSATISSPGFG